MSNTDILKMEGEKMMIKKEVVVTKNAPSPVGPYSQAVKMKGLLYTAGQIGINPSTGVMVQDSIENETRQVLENVKAILEEGGSSLEEVLKVTVFIINMSDFARMNTIYGQYFTSKAPARSCVEVRALPRGARVEIEALATCDS